MGTEAPHHRETSEQKTIPGESVNADTLTPLSYWAGPKL